MMAGDKVPYKKHTRSVNIIGALVIRENNLTMVTLPNGNIPLANNYGYGIYYNDCRFLSGYVLKINGKRMTEILSSDQNNYEATTYLTNPDFYDRNGKEVSKETLSVAREVAVPGCALESITVYNFNSFTVALDLTLELASDFSDIFVVRGVMRRTCGRPEMKCDGKSLLMSCVGEDGHRRITRVRFSPEPSSISSGLCTFSFDLGPRRSHNIIVSIFFEEELPDGTARKPSDLGIARMLRDIAESYAVEAQRIRHMHTNNSLFNRILSRSLLDLRMLKAERDGLMFYSAGVPWYDALFGRDSLTAAIQALPYYHEIARDTLLLLARYQGKKHDGWRDEEPGKIPHELRVGELANLNRIPQTPYYGSVDSTLLFLVLLSEYVDWTGDLELFNGLIGSVGSALAWIDSSSKAIPGFVSYATKSRFGLYNQGWKDSWDAVMHSDGTLARHPVAMAEVQGYAYMAKRRIATLFDRIGRRDDAARLMAEADELKKRFNEEYWMDDKGFFAMALDADGRCDVISSNPARCLWTGIVEDRYVRPVVERIFKPDMFTGWGIRTLSSGEVRYNPLGYHIGTVWPHDNSLIANGLCRHRFYGEFSRIFSAMYEAASAYSLFRLPELFAGFDRGKHNVPIKYPVACSPQAWSAGTIPYMLAGALGYRPDALNRKLTLVNPYLPPWLNKVTIENLMVGDASVSLEFEQKAAGTVVEVLEKKGDLKILVEY